MHCARVKTKKISAFRNRNLYTPRSLVECRVLWVCPGCLAFRGDGSLCLPWSNLRLVLFCAKDDRYRQDRVKYTTKKPCI